MNSVLRFAVILFIILLLTFIVYLTVLYFLSIPLWENKIIPAYLINYLLATSIYAYLFSARKKYSDSWASCLWQAVS